MKKAMCKIIFFILFIIVLVISIEKVTDILSAKNSVIKYHDMEEEDPDVLFFGSSHVVNAVYPMELWNEYGIVSYNCAGNGNTLPTSYWMMKNVLNMKEPEVVVIDVYAAWKNTSRRAGRKGVYQQHISFDWQPLSKEKIGMMEFLLDTTEEKMEFVAPITLYHDRWKELTQNDFKIPYGKEKGAEYMVKRIAPDPFSLIPEDEMLKEDTLGKQYICKMIEECQKKGIEVLLIHIPFPADEEKQKWGNSIELIAKQYNVPYLNMFYEDTGINFYANCFDSDSHLNASGARKVSKFIGKYLQENFSIPDRRGEEQYENWKEDYVEYAEMKWETLRSTRNDPWTYLSLLQDDNLDICLFFNGESEMMRRGSFPGLIKNIAELYCFQKACEEETDYFLIVDRERDKVVEFVSLDETFKTKSSFGNIQYTSRDDNGMRKLLINGEEKNYLLNNDETLAEIAIVTFEKNTGKMVDWVKFNRGQSVNVVAE